jgi:hypothetical protein
VTSRHEVVGFRACTFGDGGHYYHDGYDRLVCSCGWISAPSRDHLALVAIFKIHVEQSQRKEGAAC